MKYTEASDDAYDKKHKIKEGSKKDMALDKKRGVPEMKKKLKLPKKVKAIIVMAKKPMKGKMPIPVPMPMGPVKKLGKLKNPSIYS
jgi:hypothetical protein